MSDSTRTVLTLLAAGKTCHDILSSNHGLTDADIQRAALLALDALASPRIETRNERIQRLREKHPRAYEPWTDEEDGRLVQLWDEGHTVAQISGETGRLPNAVRARLDKHLGTSWRARRPVGKNGNVRPGTEAQDAVSASAGPAQSGGVAAVDDKRG